MKVKLEGFYYLKDALKYGSISAAAEHNYMAQSNFSKEIAKLEDALGVKLLERNKKGVVPTHAYYKIEEKIDNVLENLKDMQMICNSMNRDAGIGIRMGINHTIDDLLQRQLVAIITELEQETGAEVNFYFDRLNNPEALDLLIRDELDFAILPDWYGEFISLDKLKGMKLVKLFEDDLAICVGPKSRYWNADGITKDEFFGMTHLTFDRDFEREEKQFYHFFGQIPAGLRFVKDLNMAANVLCDTDYCIWCSKAFADNNALFRINGIRALPLIDFGRHVWIYMVYPKNKQLNETEEKLIKRLQKIRNK